MKKYALISFMLLNFVAFAQVNQFDAQGKRHGVWTKNFRNGNLRYKGRFEHGVEVGVFEFYAITGEEKPIVIKDNTQGNGLVKVSFFTKHGILESTGFMQGKERTGLWTYYFSDGKTVLSTENYQNNELNGEVRTYYRNGQLTKLAHYKNGQLEGVRIMYSKSGKVLEELTYKAGVMDGPATVYDDNAVIFAKGNYKNGMRVGTWEFNIDGEMIKTDHPYFFRNKTEDTLERPVRHDMNADPEKVLMK